MFPDKYIKYEENGDENRNINEGILKEAPNIKYKNPHLSAISFHLIHLYFIKIGKYDNEYS